MKSPVLPLLLLLTPTHSLISQFDIKKSTWLTPQQDVPSMITIKSFLPTTLRPTHTSYISAIYSSSNENSEDKALGNIATTRFPTSVEDQIRQATIALRKATAATPPIHRHSIRLLLPLIGATELDDWPGGSRQQMEAASPLVQSILKQLPLNTTERDSITIQSSTFDETDGIQALFCFYENQPKKDSCAILLPTADVVHQIMTSLDPQVGLERDLILINPEWRRPSDFSSSPGNQQDNNGGGLFSFWSGSTSNEDNRNNKSKQISYVEGFHPTFVCTSLMVEGEQIRILRSYPDPWKVFLLTVKTSFSDNDNQQQQQQQQQQTPEIDWIQIGTKTVIEYSDTTDNTNVIFDYGKPTYQEIADMITSQEGYQAKSVTERAANAFTFIRDTL